MAKNPTKITESAFRGLIKKMVCEALEKESLSWPSAYWSDDDVDDYRAMSKRDQQSVDKDQEKFSEIDRIKGGIEHPAFVEAVTQRAMDILRENINKQRHPSAMSRLI